MDGREAWENRPRMSARGPAEPHATVVAALYAAFGADARWHPVAGCTCCVDPAEAQQLGGVPIQQIATDLLARYAFKAMSTWGDAEDFKHFLPRILQCVFSSQAFGANDPELILRKIDQAGFSAWPAQQQRALADFLRSQHARIYRREIDAIRPADFLRLVARLVPVDPFLQDWDDDLSDAATLTLADAIERELGQQFTAPTCDAVAAWLLSTTQRSRLEAAFFGRNLDPCARALELWDLAADAGVVPKGPAVR